MRNILRKLPGSRSRSKSKSRKADDREKDDNNEKLKTKEEHLRVPKIQACDLKVQKDSLCVMKTCSSVTQQKNELFPPA